MQPFPSCSRWARCTTASPFLRPCSRPAQLPQIRWAMQDMFTLTRQQLRWSYLSTAQPPKWSYWDDAASQLVQVDPPPMCAACHACHASAPPLATAPLPAMLAGY